MIVISQKALTVLLAVVLASVIALGIVSTNAMLGYKKTQTKETRAALWGETTTLSTVVAEPMVYVTESIPESTTPQPVKNDFILLNGVVPGNIFLEDGKAVYMKLDTEGTYGIYSDSDLLWSFELDYSKYTAMGFNRDDEGNTYILYEDDDKNLFLNVYDRSGQAKTQGQYILNYFEGKYETITQTVLHNNALYFVITIPRNNYDPDSFYCYLMQIDLDSFECEEYIDLKKQNLGRADSVGFDDEGNLYIYGHPKNYGWIFMKLSPEGKTITQNRGVDADSGGGGRSYTTIKIVGDYVYLASYMRVEKYTLDWEYVDIILTAGYDTPFILTDNMYMHSMYGNFDIDKNENLILGTFIWNGDTSTRPIYKLNLHPKSSVPEKQYTHELVITAGFRQPFIEEAGARYMVDNQDIKISFDTVYRRPEDYNENYDTATTKLTAKLLSNDVGDIVAVGGMGINYYAALGTDIFIDLEDYLVSDKNYSFLNKPDIEALRIGESLKGLTFGVLNPVVIFNRSLADEIGYSPDLSELKWSDITRIAKEVDGLYPEVTLFNANNAELDLDMIIIANMQDLVDVENKTYNLQQSWFLELLQDFKEISKLESFNSTILTEFPELIEPNSLFTRNLFGGDYGIYTLSQDINGYEYLPAFYGEESRSVENFSRLIYAISARSNLQPEAWDFFSYLLDYERQSMRSLGAMPLNLNAEAGAIKRAGGSEAFSQEVAAIRENVDYMFDYYKVRLGMFYPLMDYVNGSISLEAAIEKAEHNVMLALSE